MLEAADLECERGGRTLFRRLTFSLKGGGLLRLAGANGSGKTSLLRILCGLLTPTAGEVRWDGKQIQFLKEEYAKRLVYLGHAPAVKDDLSAAENLSIACTIAGLAPGEEAVRVALERMGVPQDRPLRRLSQGQRRRAALSRLLLSAKNPLWLLDEPFAALDAAATRLVEELISRHLALGASVVFTTHQEAGIVPTQVIDLEARA